MVNVNDVVQLVQFFSAKKQSGMISPDDLNITLKAINLDYLKYLVGLPESYTPGQPMAPVQYQLTQQITDRVHPFIQKESVNKSQSGFFPVPDNYFAFSSIRYRYIENGDCGEDPIVKETKISVKTDAEVDELLDNTIEPPTTLYPICSYYGMGIKVWPTIINQVIFTYLRKPLDPKWGYNVVNDEPVYEPNTSVNFEWPDMCLNDLAILCAKYVGVNLEESELIGFSMNRENKGK